MKAKAKLRELGWGPESESACWREWGEEEGKSVRFQFGDLIIAL